MARKKLREASQRWDIRRLKAELGKFSESVQDATVYVCFSSEPWKNLGPLQLDSVERAPYRFAIFINVRSPKHKAGPRAPR